MSVSRRPLRRCLLWLPCLVAASSCSVAANLSAPVMLTELDRIVRIDVAGGVRSLRYQESAVVSRWWIRSWCLQPVRPVFGLLFGRESLLKLENPSPRGHVRELLRELPDETGGDLLLCAQTAVRQGWIAELEANSESRLVAVDGLCAMAAQLDVALFTEPARIGRTADGDRMTQARAGFAAGAPAVRTADFGSAGLLAYAEAVRAMVADPLGDGAARLIVLEEVTQAFAQETEPEVRAVVGTAVQAALRHVVEGVLLRLVQGRAPEDVDLRLCAMEQVRRFGGPGAVPLLLAVMAATPAQIARGESRYDPDPLVQLRLIQYCGQLGGDLATSTVTLPGREGHPVLSPAHFLATTILNEQAYYSKLRTPALVALTWSLQRPRLDPDPTWVREWLDGHR